MLLFLLVLLVLLLQGYILTLLLDVAAGMLYLHRRNVLHGMCHSESFVNMYAGQVHSLLQTIGLFSHAYCVDFDFRGIIRLFCG